MTVAEEDIGRLQKEFKSRGISCFSLCKTFRLNEEAFANKYEAFLINQSHKLMKNHADDIFTQLNDEILEIFQKELLNQLGKSKSGPIIHDKNSIKTLEAENAKNNTPQSQRVADFLSPKSSQAERQSGKLEVCLNENIPTFRNDTLSTCRVETAIVSDQYLVNRRHLIVKLGKKADELNSRIDKISKELVAEYKLEDISHPGVPNQSELVTAGMIMSESDCKMNEKSVLLLSSKVVGSGCIVAMDLSELTDYSLFPGQIIAMNAANPNGYLLSAKKLYSELPLEYALSSSLKIANYQHGDPSKMAGLPLNLILSSGPYTFDDTLDYQLLDDLLLICQNSNADVVILCGPFVDANHSLYKSAKAPLPDVLFKETIVPKLNGFSSRNPNTTVIIVPSLKDIFHDYVFPQPAYYGFELAERIKLLPNPCTFMLNEITFTISTNDILFHLSGEEISRSSVPSMDRVSRLCRHLLSQRSIYPLFPPSREANIDFSAANGLNMDFTPDILILPSSLRFFAKTVEKTICINPGQMAKKNSPGTFSKLTIHPIPRSQIPDDECDMASFVHQRTRVEILRI